MDTPYPSNECMTLVAFMEGLASAEHGLSVAAPCDDDGNLTGPVTLLCGDKRVTGESLWSCLQQIAADSGHTEVIDICGAGHSRRQAGELAESQRRGRN